MSLDRLPLQSHPAGRVLGEGVYLARTNNLGTPNQALAYWLRTNTTKVGALTREVLEESMHRALWSLR